MKICVLGSSKRQDVLYEILKQKNYSVSHYKRTDEIPDYIDADYIIFPVPTIKNGKVNMEGTRRVLPEEIMKTAKSNALAITCKQPLHGYSFCDIYEREDFSYLNAIPTAEGAIKIAMDESEISISKRNILILGFGRVGKILADRLRGLKCNITICARSLRDIYYAKALGLNTLYLKDLKKEIRFCDVIFQTIPSVVLNYDILKLLSKETKIIELSTASVGTDIMSAKELGLSVIEAPGIPAKIAPITAGEILAETVLTVISELSEVDPNG